MKRSSNFPGVQKNICFLLCSFHRWYKDRNDDEAQKMGLFLTQLIIVGMWLRSKDYTSLTRQSMPYTVLNNPMRTLELHSSLVLFVMRTADSSSIWLAIATLFYYNFWRKTSQSSLCWTTKNNKWEAIWRTNQFWAYFSGFTKPVEMFDVETDTCNKWVGCTLQQQQESDELKSIGYRDKTSNYTTKSYVTRKVCLIVFWTVFLLHLHVNVSRIIFRSDHYLLRWVLHWK